MGCAVSDLQAQSSSVEQNKFTRKKAERPRFVARTDNAQQNEQEATSCSFPSMIREDKQLDLTMNISHQHTPILYIRLHVY